MAISGRFEADFASFYEACRLANVSLRSFESSNKDAERSVNELVDSFSGRKVVAEATEMAAAVSKIGGPSRLTQAELQRVGERADEAVRKMRALGEEPPRQLLRLSEAGKSAGNSMDGVGRSVHGAAHFLDLFGIQVGPASRALHELENAADQGIGKVSGLTTAGLAFGAAIGGWEIGRAISEFGGLDEKIGDVAAHLLKLPTIADQAAAATADAIERAQKAHPQLTVLTGATAQYLNQLDAQAKVAANEHAAQVADRVDAVQRVADSIKKVMDEVAEVEKSGVWDDLTGQINSHVISLQDLAKQYHISDEAMQVLAKDAGNLERVQAHNEQVLAKTAQDLLHAQMDRAKNEADAADEAAKKQAQATDDWIASQKAAAVARRKESDAAEEEQKRAKEATEAETAALEQQRKVAEEAAAARSFSQEYDLSTPEGQARFLALNPKGQINAPTEYFKTHTLAEAVRDGLVAFYGLAPNRIFVGEPSPGEASKKTAAPPSGLNTLFPPAGTAQPSPSGGLTVVSPVFVSGVYDPASAKTLGAAIAAAQYRQFIGSRRIAFG